MNKFECRTLTILSRLYVDDHIQFIHERTQLEIAIRSDDKGRKDNALKLIHLKAKRAYKK